MVKAEYGEPSFPRIAPRGEVRGRLDHEAIRVVRDIRHPYSFGDRTGGAEQQPTAFRRKRGARVIDDRVERGAGDSDGYNASTAIAIPMPPPMHNDATP